MTDAQLFVGGGEPVEAPALANDRTRPVTLALDGHGLAPHEVVEVARRRDWAEVVLTEEAVSRCAESTALRRSIVASKEPVYGVTTGFGDSASRQVSPDNAALLQRNLVTYHLNGTGVEAAPEVARATMLIRANCLARLCPVRDPS